MSGILGLMAIDPLFAPLHDVFTALAVPLSVEPALKIIFEIVPEQPAALLMAIE